MVDAAFVAWLKEAALFTTATDPAIAALWGAIARETEIMSPLALKAGADAEAGRQLAFMGGVLVIDRHVVAGLRRDLLGVAVAMKGDALGYAAAPTVFVIGYEEAENVRLTTLTVLRRLS